MDTLLGYSNNGLNQSLNGITSFTDGNGASISDGNAIFLDTTTNTETINNSLTIPAASKIILYGSISLPDYALLITEAMMYSMYTQNDSHDLTLTGMSYDSTSNTTSFIDNITIGMSGGLATQTTFTLKSTVIFNLYGNIYLPTYSINIGQLQLSYLNGLTGNIQNQFNSTLVLTPSNNAIISSGGSVDSGSNNIAIGNLSLLNNTTGYSNIALCYQALSNNTTGNNNIGFGNSTLFSNNTGSNNIGIGSSVLYNNTNGQYNLGIGYQSLNQTTTGSYNVGVGKSTLYYNTTGQYNMAYGVDALINNTTGSHNIGIGNIALKFNKTGSNNIAIGSNSLITSGSTALNNIVALGYGTNSSIDNSIIIGTNSTNTFTNSSCIGYNVATNAANQFLIGRSDQNVYLQNTLSIQTGGSTSGNVNLTIKSGDALGSVDANSCSYSLSNSLGNHFFSPGIAVNGLIYTNNNISCVGNVDCASINSINAYYYDPTSSIQTQFDSFTTQMTLFTSLYALKASPAFTGTPTAPTAATATNTTQIATTAYVKSNLTSYATLASPVLTGTPTAPTAATATNTTQIATTAYVKSNLTSYAVLASPALTGTPTAPTATTGTNTTQIATTAFVNSSITSGNTSLLSTANSWSGEQTFNATITTVQNLTASTITEGGTGLASKYARLALSNVYGTGTTNSFQALTATTFMGKSASYFDPTSSIQTQINGLQPTLTTSSNINTGTITASGLITANAGITVNSSAGNSGGITIVGGVLTINQPIKTTTTTVPTTSDQIGYVGYIDIATSAGSLLTSTLWTLLGTLSPPGIGVWLISGNIRFHGYGTDPGWPMWFGVSSLPPYAGFTDLRGIALNNQPLSQGLANMNSWVSNKFYPPYAAPIYVSAIGGNDSYQFFDFSFTWTKGATNENVYLNFLSGNTSNAYTKFYSYSFQYTRIA